MTKRVFIAINLPEEIKNQLIAFQKKWPTLPIRWTKKENIHITLVFLGYLDENQLSETIQTTKEIASNHKPLAVSFEKIHYGPPGKMPPRMVWVQIQKNPELLTLQKDLEKQLLSLPSFKYKSRAPQQDNRTLKKVQDKRGGAREYSPHITLGRIKQWEFRRLDQRPEIDEEISLSFAVDSVEVMESRLKRGGAEYSTLGSFLLSG